MVQSLAASPPPGSSESSRMQRGGGLGSGVQEDGPRASPSRAQWPL